MSEIRLKKAPAYRAFRSSDIVAAHALSIAAGWPHRAEDWQLMFDTGNGFVAQDDSGEVIGTALYWKCGAGRGTLGLVIVSSEEQGRGIGRKLMELVLEALGNRVTFLYATPAGKPLYEKLGFEACSTVDQHQGTVGSVQAVLLPAGDQLRPLTGDDIPHVIELASRASGLDRGETFPALLDFAEGVLLERSGELVGFSLFRRFGRGYAIGPVVAAHSPDDRRAKALIAHWLAQYAGEFMRIDLPGGAGLNDWLNGLGMTRVDTVVRMVRNEPAERHGGEPDPIYRVFGIINQAMG
ncbi:GNAT family N-acetyltransferase [Paraburkholderia lacunae]|uniref:GNAT family N-acetyltransferase n=1 Tax=Paraburkholderia lacunae TaxID=2211104 RepID=A0A370MX55_9BURK|nr:GNAT family N-acetyltransferase [Paraburkholderia lacunae]RDJ97958.1 GNAT family N-acetyltransferase [Paraburkholderia lacunae]